MIRIALIAHFFSANLGDRYQGTGICHRLESLGQGVIVDKINSHVFDNDREKDTVFSSTKVPFEVFNPAYVDFSSYDVAILPTGSIAEDSIFLQWGARLLDSRFLKKLFIWGGFHDITDFSTLNEPTVLLRRVLCDARTHYYARGWLELVVFQMFAGRGQGVCGGDPVLLNDFSEVRTPSLAPRREATVVISGHSFPVSDALDLDALRAILAKFPRICFLEGVEDQRILQGVGDRGPLKGNTLSSFSEIVRSSSIIVTQRLHGIAFSKALSPGLPIILWAPKKEHYANIKFRSVAQSAAGFGLGIAHYLENFEIDDVIKVIKNPDSFLCREHEINFAYYVELTERTFREIVDHISLC